MADLPEHCDDTDIAIVGMAGRFPGAGNVHELWERVRNGDDCLSDVTDAALDAAHISAAARANPNLVRRAGVLAAVDQFDAGFFGIGPRDAAIMDPQHRHFLECCWEALEMSGHVPERFHGAIGVFGGSGMNTYLLHNLITNPALVESVGWFLLRHTGNDKDFLTTEVSYKLDLRGPSVNVQTACSTSLVALHLAAQSLLSLECDLALAGGVTIEVPHGTGYVYQEGEVLAPDGYCRAFDANSAGTVLTSGVGVVAVRRLPDALASGDPILAVMKGSAINNDGARKVSYLAPSVDGHASVVREALDVAGIDPRTIGLLEAHGTGTSVGDPIEVAALTEAYRAYTPDRGFCRLVSTKPNIGHLDTAAGVASVIKAVQALRHKTLPPLANFTAPSPLLDVAGSPFVLSGEAAAWDTNNTPRRAGVSSLGVGGTNAHVILQEAPACDAALETPGPHVLVLSARSATAVDNASEQLAAHLERNEVALADVASTLVRGRRAFAHRRVIVAVDRSEAIRLLRDRSPKVGARGQAGTSALKVALLFPGGGSQYPGMAAGLAEQFAVVRDAIGEGTAKTKALTGVDLEPLLAASAVNSAEAALALQQTTASLPAVFTIAVAIARLWESWGIGADAYIGHSLGEYVAAHLSGVLSLDDALRLVTVRAELIAKTGGVGAAMLVVPLPEADVAARLPRGLDLAVVNAPDECVVSGPAGLVDEMERRLAADDVQATRIPIAAAGHSSLLDPVLDEFRAVAKTITFHEPQRPYLSNLTGTWITPAQATDPEYWVKHMRGTVRYSDNLATVLAEGDWALIETGPGQALASYARRQSRKPAVVVSALRHPNDATDDAVHSLTALGKAWTAGVVPDWDSVLGAPRRTALLPTYPFEHQRYWIEPGAGLATAAAATAGVAPAFSHPTPVAAAIATIERRARLEDWTETLSWQPLDSLTTGQPAAADGTWAVLAEPSSAAFAKAIAGACGWAYATTDTIAIDDADAVNTFLDETRADRLVLVGGTPTPDGPCGALAEARARRHGLHGATTLINALAARHDNAVFRVITRGAVPVHGTSTQPAEALAWGPALVAAGEYPGLRSSVIDVDVADDALADVTTIVSELLLTDEPVVAIRNGTRHARRQTPVHLGRQTDIVGAQPSDAPWPDGVVVVTGGLGGIGGVVAEHLLRDGRCVVVLTSSGVPNGPARAGWLAVHGPADPTTRRIRRLEALERIGPVSAVPADLADRKQLTAAFDDVEQRHGHVGCVVHAAGVLHDRPLAFATAEDLDRVVGPKAVGALALHEELERRGGGRLVLFSSTSTILHPPGQGAYVAANSVLDCLTGGSTPITEVTTLTWGVWAGVGMAADAARRARLGLALGGETSTIDHPIFTTVRPLPGDALEVEGAVDASTWVVDEHRTSSGVAVLPGSGHIELFRAAASAAGFEDPGVLDLALVEPLVVTHRGDDHRGDHHRGDHHRDDDHRGDDHRDDDHGVMVRVVVDALTDAGTRNARLESDAGSGTGWVLHSEARLASAAVRREPLDLIRIAARCPQPVDNPVSPQQSRLRFGPRWQATTRLRVGPNEAVATLTLPAHAVGDQPAWGLHPALVDVAVGVGIAAAGGVLPDHVLVPVAVGAVRSTRPLPISVVVHATARPTESGTMLQLVLADMGGAVVAELVDLELRAVPADRFDRLDAGAQPDVAAATLPPLLALSTRLGIQPQEGIELLVRVLASNLPAVMVSSVALDSLAEPAPTASVDAPAGVAGLQPVSLIGALTIDWEELLGVAPIAPDSDFFELGGHSLLAVRLFSRIQRRYGVKLGLATLFETPTIATLAALLEEEPHVQEALAALRATAAEASAASLTPPTSLHPTALNPPASNQGVADNPAPAQLDTPDTSTVTAGPTPTRRHRSIVPIRAKGSGTPVYCVHGAGGNILNFSGLARGWPDPRPVYGIQAVGSDGLQPPDPSIAAMADRYTEDLSAIAQAGPWFFVGYSGGGLLALEVAARLADAGGEIGPIVLLDTWHQSLNSLNRADRLLNHLRNITRVGVRPVLTSARKNRAGLAAPKGAHEAETGIDPADLGYLDLQPHFFSIVNEFPERSYPFDVILITVEDLDASLPPDLGWRPWITGRLRLRRTPGDHHSMLSPQNTPGLAAMVAGFFEEYEALHPRRN